MQTGVAYLPQAEGFLPLLCQGCSRTPQGSQGTVDLRGHAPVSAETLEAQNVACADALGAYLLIWCGESGQYIGFRIHCLELPWHVSRALLFWPDMELLPACGGSFQETVWMKTCCMPLIRSGMGLHASRALPAVLPIRLLLLQTSCKPHSGIGTRLSACTWPAQSAGLVEACIGFDLAPKDPKPTNSRTQGRWLEPACAVCSERSLRMPALLEQIQHSLLQLLPPKASATLPQQVRHSGVEELYAGHIRFHTSSCQ